MGRRVYQTIGEDLQPIISLLQQGEKYKQMWEELWNEHRGEWLISDKIMDHYDICDDVTDILGNILNKTKQKYFPKEAKQAEADNK